MLKKNKSNNQKQAKKGDILDPGGYRCHYALPAMQASTRSRDPWSLKGRTGLQHPNQFDLYGLKFLFLAL